jgi:hypothetical protein
MPFKSTIRGPVLYVSWRGLSRDDLREVTASLARVRASIGRGAIYLARIPYDNSMLTSDELAVLHEFLVGILASCASIHHVVEGDGFVKSARRAIVTNLALGTPRPRDFYTHSTMAEAAATILALHQIDVSDLASRGTRAKEPERATTAFREAARLAVGRTRR